VSAPRVARYIDLLVDLFLLRRLEPLHANTGKRLVKSPKLYIRDSGLLHALLGLGTLDELLGHPVVGASWEGFVMETLMTACQGTSARFYRTAAGAEVDLVLEFEGKGGRWLVEIKRGLVPRVARGMQSSMKDLQPTRAFVVYSGDESWPLARNIEAIGLAGLARLIEGEVAM